MPSAANNGSEPSAAAAETGRLNAAKGDDSGANRRTPTGRLRGWRASIRHHRAANRVSRGLVGLVGGAIVIGGLALVPLPGPGWVIVFGGLALLATEFVWADRLEKFARNKVRAWAQWLSRQSFSMRGTIGLLTLAFVLSVVYGLFALTGVPGWIPQSWVPGLE